MLSFAARAFGKTRATAFETWASLVRKHATGKTIDIGQLRAAGLEIGLNVSQLARAFDHDVHGFQEHQTALEAEKAVAKEIPAVTKAAEAARARIPVLQEELALRVDEASSSMTMAHELASRKRLRESIEQAHPRVFAGSNPPEDAPEPETSLFDSVDSDEAVFIN